jgi:sugar lactone lactonase YvrE
MLGVGVGVGVAALAAVVATSASGLTSGGRLTTVAGGGSKFLDRSKAIPARSAQLMTPPDMVVDGRGNLYFIEASGRASVHKISAERITHFAGTADSRTGSRDDGVPATSAVLANLEGLAVDRQGNVYISGEQPAMVRKVSPDGTITTIAGQRDWVACSGSDPGDGGPATAARLCMPQGLAVDAKGNVYITDQNRIRRVSRDGTITTIAGTGKAGYSGDGGPATRARVNAPQSVAVDSRGNVYFCDALNQRVRKVSGNGTITTFVRRGCSGGEAANAGLAVDVQGNLYVADGDVLKVTPGGKVTTFLGPPTLVVDGRRVQVKPHELATSAIAYGRGALFVAAHDRIYKAAAR